MPIPPPGLVLSRQAGTSIVVGSSDETYLVTVLKVLSRRHCVVLQIKRISPADPAHRNNPNIKVGLNSIIKISHTIELRLVDVRAENARLGICAPDEYFVHRLEVYEAIKREGRKHGDGGDPDDGSAGSPVPAVLSETTVT